MAVDPRQHPQLDRFLAAMNGQGFVAGEELPIHHPGCFGCGPDNPSGLGLVAHAGGPDEVTATYTFADRFEGGPGVVHGGATAALIDDLYGRLLVRVLAAAVTTELVVEYLRPVRLEVPCELRAELVERGGRDDRDLRLRAELSQEGQLRAVSSSRFRVIGLERIARGYGPLTVEGPG